MNCVLYARVSTHEQAELALSIPAQIEAMRTYAHQHGWIVVREFVEPGVSGRTTARPALQEMLAALRQSDVPIGALLVHKVDRLARNVADHATIRALLKRLGIRLASVVENVDDSVSGQLVEHIMASIAEFYSANLGQEVKKGMRQKVLKGGWPHLAPRGYVQVPNRTSPGTRIEVHPRLGPIVREAFELYATGLYAPKRLALVMGEKGLTTRSGGPVGASYVRHILTNSFYAGRVRWHELNVVGTHRALVSQELFEKVQRLLRKRATVAPTRIVLPVPLRGLAICASCRGHMTAERHERWVYYRCSRQIYRRASCAARFCNTDRAHATLEGVCGRIQIPRTVAAKIRLAVKRMLGQRTSERDALQQELTRREHELLDSETQLTEAFGRGDCPPEEYRVKRTALQEDRARLIRRRNLLKQDAAVLLERIDYILNLATSLWDIYRELPARRRHEILRIVFQTVTLAPEGIVGFALTVPFKSLVASKSTTEESATALLDVAAAA